MQQATTAHTRSADGQCCGLEIGQNNSSANRKRLYRESLSEEQRKAAKAKDAARKQAARQNRSQQQHAADNEANKQRMSAARATRSEQQKAADKARDAARKRAQRADETPLQHEQRLADKQRHSAERRYCQPYDQVVAGCNTVRPRWVLLYNRAYDAQKAAAVAKQHYDQVQTAPAKASMDAAQTAYQAALTAANAGQAHSNHFQSYTDWAVERQKEELWQAQYQQQQSLEKRAYLLLQLLQHPSSDAVETERRAEARDLLQQLQPFAQENMGGRIGSTQRMLSAQPTAANQQRIQWQLDQLLSMRVTSENQQQLLQWEESMSAEPAPPIMCDLSMVCKQHLWQDFFQCQRWLQKLKCLLCAAEGKPCSTCWPV